MKSALMLEDRISKFYSEYDSFMFSIHNWSDFFYKQIQSSNPSHPQRIVNISHLADGDGFSSQIIWDRAQKRILNFLYGEGASPIGVESHRIMSFSSNPESEEHLDFIKECFGEGLYIVSDLSSLNPLDANRYLSSGATIIDHHPPQNGFNDKFFLINPHYYGIDGGRELSAASVSTIMMHSLFKRICSDYKGNSEFRGELKKLQDDIDFFTVLGIAGSKADMQDDVGLNKAIYEYLEERGVIEKVDCPYYGYSTKDTVKAFSQANPVVNLRYFVPEKKKLNAFLERKFRGLSSNRSRLVDKLYSEFRWAFAQEENEIGINMPYISSLPSQDIQDLNDLFRELTGSELINNEASIDVSSLDESSFMHYSDNLVGGDKRSQIAGVILAEKKIASDRPLSRQPFATDILREIHKDQLIAFGNYKHLDWSVSQLDKSQYICKLERGPLFYNQSIAEVANGLTAMSKLELGPIYMSALDEILSEEFNGKNSNLVREYHKYYKTKVYEGISEVEKRLFSKNGLDLLQDNVYFHMMDYLEPIMKGDIDIDARKMNGVISGIACNQEMLPGGDGVLFSAAPFEGFYGDGKKQLLKISGRATFNPDYFGIKINRFMERWNGGGHGPAAACVIPVTEVDNFKEDLSYFDFFRGV